MEPESSSLYPQVPATQSVHYKTINRTYVVEPKIPHNSVHVLQGNIQMDILQSYVHISVKLYLWKPSLFFRYILLTVHFSITLHNDQLDSHLLYFTIRPLKSSTCFEHYMLIIRRVNCIDTASGIVPLNLYTGRPLTERTIPDAVSIQFDLLMMSM